MKINMNDSQKAVTIGDLKAGDVFIIDGDVSMMTDNDYIDDRAFDKENMSVIIGLYNGHLYAYSNTHKVTLVKNAELNIEV